MKWAAKALGAAYVTRNNEEFAFNFICDLSFSRDDRGNRGLVADFVRNVATNYYFFFFIIVSLKNQFLRHNYRLRGSLLTTIFLIIWQLSRCAFGFFRRKMSRRAIHFFLNYYIEYSVFRLFEFVLYIKIRSKCSNRNIKHTTNTLRYFFLSYC